MRALLANRHAVWALALAAVIFGLLAYLRLPVQLFPDTTPPLVNVVTPWPGAAAEDVAEELSRTLEEEVSALEGVRVVRSTSQDDLSVVTVEFDYGRQPELAAVDVQNAVSRARAGLPGGAGEPQVLRFDASDRPVLTVGLVSDDPVRARRLAEEVFAPTLQRVGGVAAVDVFGGSEGALLVELDPRTAEAGGVGPERLAAAVRAFGSATPAGRVLGEQSWTAMRVDGRMSEVAALETLPLTTGDAQLRLGDVASVRRGALDDSARFAIDGRQAIAVQVFEAPGANTVQVVRDVQRALETLQAAHPQVEVVRGEESATFTENVVGNLRNGIWQALLLAAVVIFLFLGRPRASAVAVLSMPLAYLLTFAAMSLLGMSLDLITLTALILAVGMVVDASVVVIENVVRLRAEGLQPMEAAVQGTEEVVGPVLAGAATTMMVLVPLLTVGGFVGRIFGTLALTLLLSFLSSVVVALVVVPLLSASMGSGGRLEGLGERLTAPFRRAVDRLGDLYVGLTARALGRRKLTVALALVTFVLGVAGMRAAGSDVLPKMDAGTFFVSLETPSGTSLGATGAAVARVEQILLDQPEVVGVQSQAGFEPGMRYFGAGGVQGPTQGFITATLTPRTQRDRSVWEVQAAVRARIAEEVPGLRSVVVREMGQSARSTTSAPISVRIRGDDALVLDHLGEQVLQRLRGVDGLVEPTRTWRRDHHRLLVEVDERRAALWGLSPAEVASALARSAEGIPAGTFHAPDGGREPVRVRLSRSLDPTAAELLEWPLWTPSGAPIRVRTVAGVRPSVDQGMVTREQLARTLEVTAWVDGRPLDRAVVDVQRALADLAAPVGYEVDLVGERDDLAESRGRLLGALGTSVLGVYLLLVAQFRSFTYPLAVMAAVPLAISGVATALLLAGKSVSMPVMVALILLAGIVVNNAILILELARRRREDGVERREALLLAVRRRFRPILLTSTSTVAGMFPLAAEWALGAERLSPLAVAAMGGMIASTVLTLVVIPVLVDLLDDLARWRWRPQGVLLGALLALAGGVGAGVAEAGEPLSLDLAEAVALAEARSPALQGAEARVAAAEARAGAAKGRLLPRADLRMHTARMSPVDPAEITLPGPEPSPGFTLGEPLEVSHGVSVSLEQPLWTGGALRAGRAAAEAQLQVSEAERTGQAQALRAQVAAAWLGLASARELQEAARLGEETVAAHLARAERLEAAGRATALDVQRLQARLAARQADRLAAQAQAQAENAVLAILLGLTPDTRIAPRLDEAPEPPPDAVALGLDRRAELAAARAMTRVSGARARQASAALWPQVVLRAAWSYENPHPRHFPARDEWNHGWELTAALSWTAWDWRVRAREASALRSEARAAELAVASLAEQTASEVHRALALLQGARARREAAEEGVRLAERALATAQAELVSGRATTVELLESESELALARATLAIARVEALAAAERLEGLGVRAR